MSHHAITICEVGPDLETARTWAQVNGHRNADTRDLRLLLRIVDEWRASIGIERQKQRHKPKPKAIIGLHNRLSNSSPPKDIPLDILHASDETIAAITCHRSATGETLFESALAYIAESLRSASVQTCVIPQVSGPVASAGL
jgi:hypothetical protein